MLVNLSSCRLTFPETSPGYWSLLAVSVACGPEVFPMTTAGIYAPFRFSYHCSLDTVFSNASAKSSLTIRDFQVTKLLLLFCFKRQFWTKSGNYVLGGNG